MQGSGGAAGWWTGSGRAGEWWRPDPPREQSRPADGGVGSPPDVAGGRAAFWGLMGFTFVMLIAPQNIVPALKPLRLAWLCAVGSGTALLIERFHRRRPLAILTREMWIAAALLVWAAITVPYSFWPGGSASFLVGFYSKAIAIFWLLVGVLTTTARIRRIVWALVAMSVPLALVGAWHFASGVFFRPQLAPEPRRRKRSRSGRLDAEPCHGEAGPGHVAPHVARVREATRRAKAATWAGGTKRVRQASISHWNRGTFIAYSTPR